MAVHETLHNVYYSPIVDGVENGKANQSNEMGFTNVDYDSLQQQENLWQTDDVAILEKTPDQKHKMSPLRKFCFILSIFFCFLTIFVFLWVIPCPDQERLNWYHDYEKIELKGPINIAHHNLIFMFRSIKFSPRSNEFLPKTDTQTGILALTTDNGRVAYYLETVNEPISVNCNLIDADKDGEMDCLVLDDYHNIGCFVPVSGKWIWYPSNHSESTQVLTALVTIESILVVLPDINDDGINDLIYSPIGAGDKQNVLIILSGADGRKIGQRKDERCTSINKLRINPNLIISYNCVKNSTLKLQQMQSLSLADLYFTLTKKRLPTSKMRLGPGNRITPDQTKVSTILVESPDSTLSRMVSTVNNKKLIIVNHHGKSLKDSKVKIELIKEENRVKQTIWNYSGSQMFAMNPVTFSFNYSQQDADELPVHGFVIKLWELLNETDYNLAGNTNIRNNYTNQTKSKFHIQLRYLKETVLLLVFKSSEMKIGNASQSTIIQFCQKDSNGIQKDVCQPDQQDNSILIDNLNGDFILLSYFSTFINDKAHSSDEDRYKLKTFIHMLRLQLELPKLFENPNVF